MKYYKAILYSNPYRFEVVETTETEAHGYLQGAYQFIDGDESGYFTIRETKIDAINALKDSYKKQIEELQSRIDKYKNILGLINHYGDK